MEVKFECRGSRIASAEKLYELISEAFKNWYEPVGLTPPELLEEEKENEKTIEYTTSNFNSWKVTLKKKKNKLYIEYSGSRWGFWSFTPFKGTDRLHFEVDYEAERLQVYIGGDGCYDFATSCKVVEYKTTTPPEWGIKFYHVIEKLAGEPDKAVVFIPRIYYFERVVPYKNVYKQ